MKNKDRSNKRLYDVFKLKWWNTRKVQTLSDNSEKKDKKEKQTKVIKMVSKEEFAIKIDKETFEFSKRLEHLKKGISLEPLFEKEKPQIIIAINLNS